MAFPVKRWAKSLLLVLGAYTLLTLFSHSLRNTNSKSSDLSPRNQLLFLKTHKTGSSTIINLFQRYAFTHGLTVALPRKDDMFLGWPLLLNSRANVVLTLPNASTKFDYLINHVVYKEGMITPLFGSDPVRVTLVRQPTQQLRSSFNYYDIMKMDSETSVVKRMEQFFAEPARFDRSYQMDNWFVKSRTRNPQLADLGLAFDNMDSKDVVSRHVNMVLNNFNLVMVADLMEESCVLLRRLMRWSLQDIIFHRKNILEYAGKTDAIPDSVVTSMHDWNWGDNLLYWRSKEMLLKLMASEPNFNEELLYFRQINRNIIKYCSQPAIDNTKQLMVEATDWSEQFLIGREFCSNLLRKERPFTRLLQHKQRPDIFNYTYYSSIEDSFALSLAD